MKKLFKALFSDKPKNKIPDAKSNEERLAEINNWIESRKNTQATDEPNTTTDHINHFNTDASNTIKSAVID